ncbi:MAG TPA: DUF86 domain-containing protein [Thermoanaerobaculia bacterium]|nr:DUF86 domain-containing protein [Thermoanaerobaculia bacterium]
MTDRDLIGKKLAAIETAVQELRTLAHPALIHDDVREERFVEHTLQIAIQAVIDVASHVIADERLGEPETNREMIDLLKRYGWVPAELAADLGDMVGFRNVLVHGYDRVDLSIVEDIVTERLDDLLGFVQAIRLRLRT